MCGYASCNDLVSQSFVVPTSASNISISYWLYASTRHTTKSCVDSFSALLLDSNGNVIGKLKKVCNTDATRTWQQYTFDATSKLSHYAGKSVTLVFNGKTSTSYITSTFFVDDVSVTAK
jgi:hypothetical protein